MIANKKSLFVVLSIILGITMFWVWRFKFVPNPSSRLIAEKEIYTLLLADILSEGTEYLPLAEYTTLGQFDTSFSNQSVSSFVGSSEDVKQETVRDFEKNNKQTYPIKDYLPNSIIERMVTPQEWRISFSRIGFDSSLTQALVVREYYIQCDSYIGCLGKGGVVFLQKINGKWVDLGEFGQWISEDV